MDIRIGILGAGSWGTTIANLLAKKEFSITLWVHNKELFQSIRDKRENPFYLPGITLSHGIFSTNSIEEAVKGKDIIVSISPSHVTREIMEKVRPFIDEGVMVISGTKGIENHSLMSMSQVIEDVLPLCHGVAVLSGPSFAKEVAQGVTTAVTLASKDMEKARWAQGLLSTPYLRVYTSTDVIGVELGGALKNVISIAAGISDGLGYGYNTRAALITRGLAEITRLGVKMGANPLTFSGLSGLGDLVLTCTGDLSRNRSLGIQLGKGKKLKEILSSMEMVAEGVRTTMSAYHLAKKFDVEMPITREVYLILYEEKPCKKALEDLLARDLKNEL